MAATAKHLQAKYAEQERQSEERAQRWRALSPLERALYIVAEETGNGALLRVVTLVGKPEVTANRDRHNIPSAFEPER